ncbi:unnamed protein product [Brassica oleracea]
MINSSPPEKVYRLKDMTRSVFFFFIVSLLLLLLAADLATASSGNTTSGFGYGGCASGDTVGECITAAVEEEKGVEAVVRRVLQQQRRKLSYAALQKQQSCNGKIAGNCIGTANRRNAPCTYYNRCKQRYKYTVTSELSKEAVVRRILQPRRFISPKPLQRQPALPCKIAGNCIKAVNGKDATCTYYDRCQRSA